MGVITKKLQNKKYVGGANTNYSSSSSFKIPLNQPKPSKPSKFRKFRKFLSTITNPFKKPPQKVKPVINVNLSTGRHLGNKPASNSLSVEKPKSIPPEYLIPGQQVTGNIYSTAPPNNNIAPPTSPRTIKSTVSGNSLLRRSPRYLIPGQQVIGNIGNIYSTAPSNNIAPSIPARSINPTVSGNSLPGRPRRPNIYEEIPGNELELLELQTRPPLTSVEKQIETITALKEAAAAAASKTNNNNAEPYATYVPKPGVFGTNTERLRDAYKLTFPELENTSITNNGRKNTNTIRRGNRYLKLKNTLRRNNNNRTV